MFESDTVWELNVSQNIRFGIGSIKELPSLFKRYNASTTIIITDPGVEKAGIINDIEGEIPGNIDYHVYSKVKPEPTLSVYEGSINFAKEVDPDLIIGVGGGSSMDVAKTTGIVYEYGGDLLKYAAPPTGDGKQIPDHGIPTICIPTTAGTGSETSPVSVISLPDEDLKVGVTSRYQIPDTALVDPSLMVSLPPGPTASSGMDALSHALEAYTTPSFDTKARPSNPMERPDYGGRTLVTDKLAKTSIELVANNLQHAVNNSRDLTARRNMALASLLAGIAFTNAGVTANHALAMATGSKFEIPHGTAVAIYLPAVIQFNAPVEPERFSEVAEIFGIEATNKDTIESALQASRIVEDFAAAINIPSGVSEFGVTDSDIPILAEKALQLERLMNGNPRRADQEDLERIIRNSL
ncbi:NAD-dependent alcohol dehydrogenase [halophilic archaeon]|nr:NAD-dependent alcohol dehydrogenase [halophilic archaeon]